MAVVVAPAIGPTLGGWITDNFNWHWIFFINIPIGLFSLWLSNRMVEDPPFLKVRREAAKHLKVDFTGLGLVAIGVGFLEFTLDKGQEKDWFGSGEIQLCALIAAITLIFFCFWEWNHPDPIVDLKLLKNRNFGTAVFLQLILGMVLFGSTVLIPQYLQGLLGYTAERAGEVLSPAGFVMMAMMMVAGRSLGLFDPRIMVAIGYAATAAGIYNLTRLDLEYGLPHRHGLAHAAGHRPAADLHSHQHAELRRRPALKDEPDLQPVELRPKPGRKRRHCPSHHLPRSKRPGESAAALRPRLSRQLRLPLLHRSHPRAPDARRHLIRRRDPDSDGPGLPADAPPGPPC